MNVHETKLLTIIKAGTVQTVDDVPMFLLGALGTLTSKGIIASKDGVLKVC